jgi:anti-anti-sigma factor
MESNRTFEIRQTRSDAEALVMYLCGEFDSSTTPEFESVLSDRLPERTPLLLDLTELAFMDSSAIRALFRAKSQADRAGVDLTVRLPDEGQVHEILTVAGVNDVFPPPAPASTPAPGAHA